MSERPGTPEDADFKLRELGPVRVLFAGRNGGCSAPPFDSLNVSDSVGDDAASVASNRAMLARAAGLEPGSVRSVRQVHGHDIAEVTGSSGIEADGLVCNVPGVGALIQTADCLPVLVASPDAFVLLHAGWRGLGSGVIEAGVARLGSAREGTLRAVLGPCAGACCYQVGQEVFDALGIPGRNRDAGLDLRAVARTRLEAVGVIGVESLECCTICDPDRTYFSHRADGVPTGRQGTLAWLSR